MLPDLEGIYFHYICISHACGKLKCSKTKVRSTACFERPMGFFFSRGAFHAAGDAQQQCKTDPRNFQAAKPEDEKFKSVYEIGRNSIRFSWVLFSVKIGLRLNCLKLNLSCVLPPDSVLFVADLSGPAANEAKLLHSVVTQPRFTASSNPGAK